MGTDLSMSGSWFHPQVNILVTLDHHGSFETHYMLSTMQNPELNAKEVPEGRQITQSHNWEKVTWSQVEDSDTTLLT